ncbi:MAG: MmgE/PrpD family protein, partial [Fimbriimonadaceae bacterium]|nr:MmgE/PrpD family protein [Fimbriimonadaceae bacterium]
GRFVLHALQERRLDEIDPAVRRRTKLFHADAVLCGMSALARRTNAPNLLWREAMEYEDPKGATVFGSRRRVKAEKAIAANSSAVREWDSNGTNFGYRPELGHTAGEFGHNDFYPVCIAACQESGRTGADALQAMMLLDEVRGRLAEVFSLKSYKIDHVLHGAIASAAVYGALRGATEEQIESAIGMTVAHHVPWRAIRAGKQLSDSKGASAAISTEAAVLAMKRSLRGFLGPADIFRNPESLFRRFEPTEGDSPFDLVLSEAGSDFAVMGMHFKLGLYEHQSAGALQGVLNLLLAHPELAQPGAVQEVLVTAYEPAFGIIGDPAKRNPSTRQSADHSMVYILARLLCRAAADPEAVREASGTDDLWIRLMLMPDDYGHVALTDPETRRVMDTIRFEHGGPEFDRRYPEGIPTSVQINGLDSGLIMFPAGHAGNREADLERILESKFERLGRMGLGEGFEAERDRLMNLEALTAEELLSFGSAPIQYGDPVDQVWS